MNERKSLNVKNAIYSLWLRVQEPRATSTIYFFAYLAVTVLGLAILVDPPRTIQSAIGQSLVMGWAGLLVLGGALGVSTVLQGAWLFERAGAIACMFAMAIYGAAIIGVPVTQPSQRVATICFCIFAILAFAVRLVRTRHYSFDPEK